MESATRSHSASDSTSASSIGVSLPESTPTGAIPAGELVVLHKGNLTGQRYPLSRPLSLVGRADDCDILLQGKNIGPRHCLIHQSGDGVFIRDLGGPHTRLNGKPVKDGALSDGDTLQLGTMSLRVCLPGKPEPKDAPSRPALRVQAAAVAAQQSALLEDQIRLQQRLAALDQQEKQLSTHLEDKRRTLIVLQEKAQAERAALHRERSSYEQFINRVQGDLTQAQRELVDGQQRVQAERRRLADLHRKLRQRWQRHWQVERQKMLVRQEELANEECNLAKEGECLQQAREALGKERLQFNAEYELGRCRLNQAWKKLRAGQKLWRGRRRQERSALRLRRQEFADTEARLVDARRQVQQEQEQWAQARPRLEKEIDGLNNRIRHQRDVIFQQQQEAARLDALLRAKWQQDSAKPSGTLPTGGSPAADQSAAVAETVSVNETVRPIALDEVAEPDPLAERLGHLEQLAGDLADQRSQLVEQWHKLVDTQHRWDRDREQATVELETAARGLQDHEAALGKKDQHLQTVEEALARKHRELLQLRQQMVGWRARLRAREMAWEKERNQRLIEIRQREELIKHHFKSLGEIRRRWAVSRRLEVEKLRLERTGCESLRREYAAIRQEWQQRCTMIDQEKRQLAEKNLALEQFRQEVLNQTDNAPAAERRVERIRRRWVTQNANAIRALARDREAFKAELADAEARFEELQKRAEDVVAAETDFTRKKIAWEHKQALLAAERAGLRQELKTARTVNAAAEQQIVRMHAEVERIASSLLNEPDPPALRAEQAA
ncbi:MAG: FHA domain-containing protein [Planctomycetes bacterium]|nr:FHA domain-containing protein [Planctomycetota bacterium]